MDGGLLQFERKTTIKKFFAAQHNAYFQVMAADQGDMKVLTSDVKHNPVAKYSLWGS